MSKVFDDYREMQKNITFFDKVIMHFSLERRILRAVHNYSDKGIEKRKKICRLLKKAHIDLYPETLIGKNLKLPHPHNITIGFGTEIGNNVTIYQNVTIGQKNYQYPQIGDNVTIYPGAIIIGDIKIGNNSIIGAGAVVLQSCENGSILAGNPAHMVGNRNEKN